MYHDTNFPPPAGRLAQFARMIAAFELNDIEAAVDMLIERLDQAAGDPDLEPEDDRCAAGDDHMTGGPVAHREWWDRAGIEIGDDTDAEDVCDHEEEMYARGEEFGHG